ncbi:Uncharacterised protein [Mycobacteroides abscessus]|nr:Uncharacterised protein [Mycobacteroides abscessus]
MRFPPTRTRPFVLVVIVASATGATIVPRNWSARPSARSGVDAKFHRMRAAQLPKPGLELKSLMNGEPLPSQ